MCVDWSVIEHPNYYLTEVATKGTLYIYMVSKCKKES